RLSAKDRIPYGGTLRLHLPFELPAIDPHDLLDLDAAVLSSALFAPLYAGDTRGRPYPSRAGGPPTPRANGLQVVLRPGLQTAAGQALTAADVVASLQRASARGGKFLLQPFGKPRALSSPANTILFPSGDPTELALCLASPLTAVVPRRFK